MSMIQGFRANSKICASLAGAVLLICGCTNEKSGVSATPKLKANAAKISSQAVANSACAAEDLAFFERQDGEVVDLSRELLPRGTFIARTSEMLVERKFATGLARALVREATGGKSTEIVCAENFDKINREVIDVTMTGLVKFEIGDKSTLSGLVARQFFFFQDQGEYGAILSNPKSLSSQSSVDLKKLLGSQIQPGQVVRLTDRTFALRYQRERDGLRARLVIHLDLIQN